jgi:uncharacterized protein (DUF4415 family)
VANEAHTVRRSLAAPDRGRTDWRRVRSLTDADISAAVRDDPDAAPIMDESWFAAAARQLPAKKQLTLRLDQDVVDFFKSVGDGYQPRMNAVLRAYMEHVKRNH